MIAERQGYEVNRGSELLLLNQEDNSSSKNVRLICICSPAGQENFFQQVGSPVATRTTPPPKLDKDQQQQFMEKAKALAPKYRTELLKEV